MILDSDVLITILAPSCPPDLIARLSDFREVICTTSINWAEVRYGLRRRPPGPRLLARYEESVLPALQVLAFDQKSAELYGQLRVDLERQGIRLGDADLMIAAISIQHDLPLATGNLRHFSRVPGLRVERWL